MNETGISNAEILLVDDDQISHILIKKVIEELNSTLFSAFEGPGALEMCKLKRYDLILLDIMMDPMSGIEVSHALDSCKNNSTTPRIFITGRNEESIISQVYESGAVDYITKPFHMIELKMRIITHLNLKNTMKDLENKNRDLTEALQKIKTLQGIIPICSRCKKIRDDDGYWNRLEQYIEKHSMAEFSHSLCESCASDLYGSTEWYNREEEDG